MRNLWRIFAGAVCGAIATTLIAFGSARPFWPDEIGFGRNISEYFPFFSFTANVGFILGTASGFAVAASPAQKTAAARLLIIAGLSVVALSVPIAWLLEENGAWPVLRASDTMTAALEDFGPFIICWFPLLWGTLLAVQGFRQSRS